jgi:CubicO group peptidase (beta-lactamase class C family)
MPNHSHSEFRTIILLTVTAITAPCGVCLASTPAERIDNLLKCFNRYGQFNGVALVAEDDGFLYRQGFGLANMEWNIPNSRETRFEIASFTKAFTAALTL